MKTDIFKGIVYIVVFASLDFIFASMMTELWFGHERLKDEENKTIYLYHSKNHEPYRYQDPNDPTLQQPHEDNASYKKRKQLNERIEKWSKREHEESMKEWKKKIEEDRLKDFQARSSASE